MKQLAADKYADRLRAAMARHMDRTDYREPLFRCLDCHDTGFVKSSTGDGVKPCRGRTCPAWTDVRLECERIGKSTGRRKRKKDEVPF